MVTETDTLTIASLSESVLSPSYGTKTVALTGDSISAVLPQYAVRAQGALFTESGAGTYEWGCVVPAGSIILDIGVHCVAEWAAATSAALEVGIGGGDEDGFFTAVNLKATDLTAAQSINFSKGGGKEGALAAGTATHWNERYCNVETTVSFTAVSVGAGTTGRTRCWVMYMVPTYEAAVKS